jgi:CRISPR/Cas system type I-B associated protein Csh2 (Cas7 group RAMP superfamily)
MNAEHIANIEDVAERKRAIENYGLEIHDSTKKLVDSFMNDMAAFVEDYRNMRRKQVQYFKTKDRSILDEAKALEKALDQKAAKMFVVKQPGLEL